NLDDYLAGDSTGAVRRFADPDVALVEILWRCWIASLRFSGLEDDVIRTPHGTYALVAPKNGPDRRDEARLGLLQWADPTYLGVKLDPAPDAIAGESSGADELATGLPWPW